MGSSNPHDNHMKWVFFESPDLDGEAEAESSTHLPKVTELLSTGARFQIGPLSSEGLAHDHLAILSPMPWPLGQEIML